MKSSPGAGRSALLAVVLWSTAATAQLQFTEISVEAGVRFTHDPLGFFDNRGSAFPNSVGSGAAWVDVNGDGWLDLVVSNGTNPGNYLFLNDGDGSFTDTSDLMHVRTTHSGNGITVADINNDAYPDILMVNHLAEPELFMGTMFATSKLGGSFGLYNIHYPAGQEPYGYTGPLSMGVSYGDYDNDGYLDAYIANYLFAGDVLMHGLNGGGFINTGKVPEPEHGYGCMPLFFDYDLDGDEDILVINDLMRDFLWRNEGAASGWNFTEVANTLRIAGGIDTSKPLSMGMGGVAADFDNDLDLDVYVTNFRANALWQNPGNWESNPTQRFTNVAPAKGVDFALNSWGCDFFDADNDGDLDLVMIGGWVEGGPDVQTRSVPNRLWLNSGAPDYNFTEISESAGFVDYQFGRSQAVADYDRDGDLDVFVTNISYYDGGYDGYTPPIEGHTLLYRNELDNGCHWINLRVQGGGDHGNGSGCNRDAIGVRVYVTAGGTTQMRVVNAATGFMGQNSLELEFGLGSATVVDEIRIHWKCGGESTYEDVAVDQFYRAVEFEPELFANPVAFASIGAGPCARGVAIEWRCDGRYPLSSIMLQRALDAQTPKFQTIEVDFSYEGGSGRGSDESAEAGVDYLYRMVVRDQHGNRAVSPTLRARGGEEIPLPSQPVLGQNFPNPFNPTTTIRFALPRAMDVRILIHDAAGRQVRELYRATLPADAAHEVHWDGRDDAGDDVASGSYFYSLVTPEGSQSRKLVLIR